MSHALQPRRLNLVALARSGEHLSGQTALADLARLADDVPPQAPLVPAVAWQAHAQFRAQPGGTDQLWLYLQAQAQMPLTCQRCLAPVVEPLEIDRWFRFVETEAQAEAEDDEAEEDLLVLEPQFDLLALPEDELLMSLPLVPMHERCPQTPVFQVGDEGQGELSPHPFAALAKLRKRSG